MKLFEIIEHTADVGIKVYGNTLNELFLNAVKGMYSLISETKVCDKNIIYKNQFESFDYETLLIELLNDLIYQTFVNKKIFSDFEIIVKEGINKNLEIQCFGENYSFSKHGTLFELKAATFHNLKIEFLDNVYFTTIIFDT